MLTFYNKNYANNSKKGVHLRGGHFFNLRSLLLLRKTHPLRILEHRSCDSTPDSIQSLATTGLTPGNVLAVRWRVPSTVEGAQYSGGLSCSTVGGYHEVQWRVRSTVEGYLKYSGGCGVRWRAIISTVEGYLKYSGGLSCSTAEGAEYSGGLSSVRWRVQVQWRAIILRVGGYHAVQWRVQVRWRAILQYGGGLSAVPWGAIMQYSGGCGVRWRAIISTVEGASTVEGYHAVQWRAIILRVGGYHAVQWRVQVRWRAILQYSGGLSFSAVEGAKYSGGY